jgi:glycosyltransferase involved in cell wall biosynthesis
MKRLCEVSDTLEEGIRTIRIFYFASPLRPINYLIYLWSILRVSKKLIEIGFKPEVIHAHVFSAGVPAVVIGKLYQIPVVITEHWTGFPRRTLGFVEKTMARFAMKGTKWILPVSHNLQKNIEAYGIKGNFQIVPNVVDTTLFYPLEKDQTGIHKKRILFVGLLTPRKGVAYLLHALAQLRQKRDDWELCIVGDGPARLEFENLAASLSLTDRVVFHGLKSKPEIADFMRQADFFVLPSLWENLPCVIIEAMASGLPIISTHAGGIPELVNKDTGILVAPGDVRPLSEALASMMDSFNEYNRLSIAKRAQQYSLETIGRELHNIYEKCVQR